MIEYIDRKKLLETLNKNNILYNADVNYFIMNAPIADVQEIKHGEWNDNIIGFCNVCTECGAIVDRYSAIKNNSGKLNYCPNCGAKMDGGQNG